MLSYPQPHFLWSLRGEKLDHFRTTHASFEASFRVDACRALSRQLSQFVDGARRELLCVDARRTKVKERGC